jgi:serine acetyltransferase
VDGRVVGATPIVLKDVPAGSHVVRVESNSYQLWSAAARVVADQQTRVIATLQRGSKQQ